jgi:hypothetical protein
MRQGEPIGVIGVARQRVVGLAQGLRVRGSALGRLLAQPIRAQEITR